MRLFEPALPHDAPVAAWGRARCVPGWQESHDKTSGGIFLPDSAKKKPQRGKILAVGPGKMLKDGTRRSLQVKEGDTVLFTSWAGDEFKEYKDRKSVV